MIVCVPVTPAGEIDPSCGRASRVGIADVEGGRLVHWQEFEVGWDVVHDTGTEGGPHARIARFTREHGAQVVVAHRMGDAMLHMLGRMGLDSHLGAAGDARVAVLAVAGEPRPYRHVGSYRRDRRRR